MAEVQDRLTVDQLLQRCQELTYEGSGAWLVVDSGGMPVSGITAGYDDKWHDHVFIEVTD